MGTIDDYYEGTDGKDFSMDLTELKKTFEIKLNYPQTAGYIRQGIHNILKFWEQNKDSICIADVCLDFLRTLEKIV
jgi:hypothetical protein